MSKKTTATATPKALRRESQNPECRQIKRHSRTGYVSLDNADTVIEGGPLLRLMKWSGCPISRVRCEKWGLFSSGLLPRCRTPVCCKTCEPSGTRQTKQL